MSSPPSSGSASGATPSTSDPNLTTTATTTTTTTTPAFLPSSANTTSSPSPSSSHSAGTPSPGQTIAQYLESICTSGALAINSRDFDYSNNDLYKCVTPNFRAHFENFPHPLTLLEHSNILRQTIDAFPNYHVEVKGVSSEVREERGEATVYMESEVTGAPEGVKTVLVNEFRFRRVEGAWRCVVHHGMKGVGEHDLRGREF